MQLILRSILAAAALAAAVLPGHAQAGRVSGITGASGSVVFVDGRHAQRAVLGSTRHRHHFRRFVVVRPFVVSPFGAVRVVRVPGVAVPVFTVPAVTVANGNGFVILNGGFAVNSLNGFTTGSIGPFTTFSNSFVSVPVVTRVVPLTGARAIVGRGMAMAGRR
jgi:hypothetical protein